MKKINKILLLLLVCACSPKIKHQIEQINNATQEIQVQTNTIKDNANNINKKIQKIKQDVKNIGKCDLKDVEEAEQQVIMLQEEINRLDLKVCNLKNNNLVLEQIIKTEIQEYKDKIAKFKIYCLVLGLLLIIMGKKYVL